MKLIELHILQSFPVSCLNRDDVGSPKTAVFGGAPRARISSQCLKRSVRLLAHDLCPDLFASERTRLIVRPLADRIEKLGTSADQALESARLLCDSLATFDEKAEKKGVQKVKTTVFFSPLELDQIAATVHGILSGAGTTDQKRKKIVSAAGTAVDARLKDGGDIAIFGRMVATDHSLTLEGAGMFSHALSTHKADNEIDFWTAVDDRQQEDPTVADEDRAGSAGMGTLEFTSAVYYRFAALNLDLLADKDHLESMGAEARKEVVGAFIRAAILAIPSARHNSMNANTEPGYVLGVYKEAGQPVQLINAFETPVFSKNGYLASSVRELLIHRDRINRIFGAQGSCWATGSHEPASDEESERRKRKLEEAMIPEHLPLDEFCTRLTAHVI